MALTSNLVLDQFPNDANEWADYDGDGIGDNTDADDDNDGFSDAIEIASNTDPFDDTSLPIEFPDFSDAVDAEIGSASGLDSIEGNLALWLDAANINGTNNVGLTDNQAISRWFDMSGNGNHASRYSTDRWPSISSVGI